MITKVSEIVLVITFGVLDIIWTIRQYKHYRKSHNLLDFPIESLTGWLFTFVFIYTAFFNIQPLYLIFSLILFPVIKLLYFGIIGVTTGKTRIISSTRPLSFSKTVKGSYATLWSWIYMVFGLLILTILTIAIFR